MRSAKTAERKQKAKDVADGAQRSLPPDDEQIRQAAYYKWEAAGCPCGDGAEFWLAAEAEQTRTNPPAKAR
jgi:hypothetical protein